MIRRERTKACVERDGKRKEAGVKTFKERKFDERERAKKINEEKEKGKQEYAKNGQG